MQDNAIHTQDEKPKVQSTLASGSSLTGIMPEMCIFCTKKDKKHNKSKQKLILVETGAFEEKIKRYATTLGDQALLPHLGSFDFVAKEMRYYGICRTKYETAAEQVSKASQN